MTALLWTLVVAGALNIAALIVVVATSPTHHQVDAKPRSPVNRMFDLAYTIGLGVWALWLLAAGVS